MTDFLDNRTQRVILNIPHGLRIELEFPKVQILDRYCFSIYINDLSDKLAPNPKLFVDNTSLFSVVKNVDASNIDLNNNLKKIGEWAFQRKVSFNPDPTKQAQELIFFL